MPQIAPALSLSFLSLATLLVTAAPPAELTVTRENVRTFYEKYTRFTSEPKLVEPQFYVACGAGLSVEPGKNLEITGTLSPRTFKAAPLTIGSGQLTLQLAEAGQKPTPGEEENGAPEVAPVPPPKPP